MAWPVLNLVRLQALVTRSKRPGFDASAAAAAAGGGAKQGAMAELFFRHLRLSTYLAVTLVTYYFFFPLDRAAVLAPGWIAEVVARNLAIEWLCYGGWHLCLYGGLSGLVKGYGECAVVKARKFNPADQYAKGSSAHNLRREMIFTTLGFLMSSAFEVVVMHLWASGRVPYLRAFWSRPAYSVFHLLLVGYWRDFHFYFCHRVMHPWGKVLPVVGDVGAFLYKRVHSLHHKSYNPGPFSGLSMHPAEHLLYYTCTLLCWAFTLHPIHFLFNKFHADLSPLPGHDGYDQPAGGSYFHYIHHAHYEYNYGTPMVPLDQLFGSYADGSQWEQKKTEPKGPPGPALARAAAGAKTE